MKYSKRPHRLHPRIGGKANQFQEPYVRPSYLPPIPEPREEMKVILVGGKEILTKVKIYPNMIEGEEAEFANQTSRKVPEISGDYYL